MGKQNTFLIVLVAVIVSFFICFGSDVVAATYDDFADSSIDPTKWQVEDPPNVIVAENGGVLELSILPSASGPDFYGGVTSTLVLTGDFDVQVDFNLTSWPSFNGVRTALVLESYSESIQVERSAWGADYQYDYYVMNSSSGGLSGEVVTNDTVGKLRLKRVGEILTGYYYDATSGWQEVASYTNQEAGFNGAEQLRFSLSIWSHDQFFNPGGQTVTAAFDNLWADPAPVAPVAEVISQQHVVELGIDQGLQFSRNYQIDAYSDQSYLITSGLASIRTVGTDLPVTGSGTWSYENDGTWQIADNSGNVYDGYAGSDVTVFAGLVDITDLRAGASISAGSSGFDNNSLSGDWHIAKLAFEDSDIVSMLGGVSVDNQGSYILNAEISTNSIIKYPFTEPGNYIVDADGRLTIILPDGTEHHGGLNLEEDIFVLATAGQLNKQEIFYGVRKGAGSYSDETLVGKYHVSTLNMNTGYRSAEYMIVTFDGNGGWAADATYNDGITPMQSWTESGTYSMHSDGTFVVTVSDGTIDCALSADSENIICSRIDSLDAHNVSMGVRSEDSDGDGYPDGNDSFPIDPAASIDSDGDGYPDDWNVGKTEADSTTGLALDAYPDDPDRWQAPSVSALKPMVLTITALMMAGFIALSRRLYLKGSWCNNS